ncbi:MAG: hypothetical protein CBC84_000905 [Pelagibacteraceae bacterium TMED124]|nr:hypothetical protein [Candidatus Neomarinimicrobiota bacterium]RPG19115.1 MAG: hypothetical protein CBC84_000905 [Pelagibacteraceae bacterium TMED124]|tara:strand:+ start:16378 stop:17544 length:1167 start_codon:yes stop_codon:yes gene_type:complete
MLLRLFVVTFILSGFTYSACSDVLSQSDCESFSSYGCEWNSDSGQCQQTGGGGGGSAASGPYQVASINEGQGLRNGPDYAGGVLYYPSDGDGSQGFKSIVFTPGFGGDSSAMSGWANFFASHGFIAMSIGPNDPINDSHQQRGEGLLDAIETIRQENSRSTSPLFGLIDTNSYSVGGHSMGGGASHNAAMDDDSIQAILSFNPTALFEDCNYCASDQGYCICLVPELINHTVPSLIYAGEFELNDLGPDYQGLIGPDMYTNMQETTDKIYFETTGNGHSSAAFPNGDVADYALNWLKYQVLDDTDACEALLSVPSTSSQYITNLECFSFNAGDVNQNGSVDVSDIILLVNFILGISSPSGSQFSTADLNDDSVLSVLDIILIINIILN